MERSCRGNHNAGDRQARFSPEIESIFINAIDPMLVLDNRGCCITGNSSAMRFLGLTEKTLPGCSLSSILSIGFDFVPHWTDLLHHPAHSPSSPGTETVGTETVNGTWQIPHATAATASSLRYIDYQFIPYIGENQHLLMLRDVTEQNAADQQRQAITQKMLQRASRSQLEGKTRREPDPPSQREPSPLMVLPNSVPRGIASLQSHPSPTGTDPSPSEADVDADAQQMAMWLNLSNNRYKAVVNTQADLICRFLPDTTLTFVNAAYCRYFGKTEDELMGESFLALIPDEGKEAVQRQIEELNRLTPDRPVVIHEHPVALPHGEQGWQEWSNTAIFDDEGRIIEFQASGRDITPQKQLEQALKTSERQLRTVLETMSLIGIMLDRQGRLVFCNDYLLNLTGWTREEVLHQSWFERFLPTDVRGHIQQSVFEETLKTGTFPVHYENEIVTRTGDRRLIAWNNTIFRNTNGEVISITSIGQDITEQRHAEQALQQESQLFIGGPTVVFQWQVTEGWPVAYVSPNVTEQLGYAPEDLTSGRILFADLVHPDDLERVAQEVATFTCEGRTTFEQEYRLRRADGEYRWFSDFTVVTRNERGNAISYAGYIQDISDRKQTELALAKRELTFRSIFEQNIVGVAFYSNGQLLQANQAFCALLGYAESELRVLGVGDIAHPDDWATLCEHNERLTLGECDSFTVENRYIRRDGTILWGYTATTVIRDDQGHPQFVATLLQDITARKRSEIARQEAQAALMESEERLRLALEGANMGLWDWNIITHQVVWSPGLERIMGMAPGQFDGTMETVKAMIHPDDRERVEGAIARALNEDKPYSIEFRFTKPDGTVRWAAGKGAVYRNDRGHPIRMTGIDVDITDRKESELALQQSRQRYFGLIHSIDGVVWELDFETLAFTFVSPQAERLLGYPCDDWLADPTFWVNHIHPDDRDRIVNLCLEESRRMRNHTFDYRMIAADGRTVWVRDIVNVTAKNGKPVTLQGLLIDITAEKQQQELLRHYERIVSATPDAIALVDRQYQYMVVNQAYMTWHTCSEQELIGQTVADLFGDAIFQQRLKSKLDEALAGNIVRFQDWFTFRGVGTQFLSVTYAPYFEEHGSVIGVVIVARDMTGLKQAEVVLHRQAEQERLLAGITHRIRQTLNLQSILDTTVAEVQRYLQVNRVLVYEFDEALSGVVIAEAVDEGFPSLWGRIITDRCFTPEKCLSPYTDGYIQNVADIHTAGLPACYVKMLSELGVRANLVVPILQNHHIWGLLVAQHCADPRPWWQDEIDLLRQLTNQLAIAIQQAELYKQVYALNINLESQVRDRTADLERTLAFESLLKRITDHVRDSLEEHHILERAVRELAEGLNAYSCDTSIYDLDARITTIQHEWVRSTMAAAHGSIVRMDDFPSIYAQLLDGQSLQFCWLPVSNEVRVLEHPVMCFTCPVIDDQGVLGDVWIYRAANHVFDRAEIQLVEQVANQCAIALRQARLYESAQAQVTELERLNRLKDDFLSTVSHELRTPMSNIKMAIQMFEIYLGQTNLLEDKELPLGQYFQILKDECDRETNLINNLLDLTRLDSDIEPLFKRSMPLSPWVDHIAEVFVERAHKQQQTLTLHIAEDLVIYTDLTYLERILVELLNNACKYTPEGEHIRVAAHPCINGSGDGVRGSTVDGNTSGNHGISASPANILRFVVSNSGVELSPVECDRIFQKFYRIPNSDPWKHGGTGLGLALVQKLAQKLGGTIRAESSHNEVRFILDLPLHSTPPSSEPNPTGKFEI